MSTKVEVSIDNIESLEIAQRAGADSLEISSSLCLGGLTPNAGFVQKSLDLSGLPLHVMIRPRSGHYVYSDTEIDIMVSDIKFMQLLGVQGVVLSALTADGLLDLDALARLTRAARGMIITFSRAFDFCVDQVEAIDQLIKLGFDRVLTSGKATYAVDGTSYIASLITHADGNIVIVPTAGINENNVQELIDKTQANTLQLSPLTKKPDLVQSELLANQPKQDNQSVYICSAEQVNHVRLKLQVN